MPRVQKYAEGSRRVEFAYSKWHDDDYPHSESAGGNVVYLGEPSIATPAHESAFGKEVYYVVSDVVEGLSAIGRDAYQMCEAVSTECTIRDGDVFALLDDPIAIAKKHLDALTGGEERLLRQAKATASQVLSWLDLPPDRVLVSGEGGVAFYFFGRDKTPEGAHLRYAAMTFGEDPGATVSLTDREADAPGELLEVPEAKADITAAALRVKTFLNR